MVIQILLNLYEYIIYIFTIIKKYLNQVFKKYEIYKIVN